MKTKSPLALLVAALMLMFSSWVQAFEIDSYSAERLSRLQALGSPVALHFHADWCSTCRRQQRVFEVLREDPALAGITVLVADYDKERQLRLVKGVRAQSTIIVFRGDEETARLGGVTRKEAIRDAFLSAL